jgi:putative endonuclease
LKARYKTMLKGMQEKARPAPRGAAVERWFLYILECCDGTLYTGVTTDVQRRFEQHNAGKAARYTRTRLPVTLRYWEKCGTRTDALVRECAVKALKRPLKEKLIATGGARHEMEESA